LQIVCRFSMSSSHTSLLDTASYQNKNGSSSDDISEWARQLGGNLRACFRGVYSKDTIPTLENDQCMVINIENSTDSKGKPLPGTHWVAAGIQNKQSWYFDSFGLDPPIHVTQMLPAPIQRATHQIQNNTATTCGLFALAACDAVTSHPSRAPVQSLESFESVFETPNLESSDKKLHQYFVHRVGRHHEHHVTAIEPIHMINRFFIELKRSFQ